MMRTPVQQLAFQLQNVFGGSPWYGESVMTSLHRIPAELAVRKREGRSVLRLVRHMLAWRTFVLEKLKGNDDYDIEFRGPADWPEDDKMTWPEVLAALEANQAELLKALEQFPESRLLDIVPGRKFRYVFMIEGLAQHDIYHLGQVNLLVRMLDI